MNIGILTLPLYNNYGGILQAYALKTILEKMGHNPILIKRFSDTSRWAFYLKRFLGVMGVSRYSGKRYRKITNFVNREFQSSSNLLSHTDFINAAKCHELDALIVGSDQVWRREYCIGSGMDFFLDLDLLNTKRISYAASFGIDTWDYSVEETRVISNLLKKFSGVSLREKNFIPTLFENTGCEAKWCLDPTLLLTTDDYKKLVKKCPVGENYVFVYWLGSRQELCKHLPTGQKIIQVRLDDPESCSIEDWLSYIYYADSIITDSFHGCVFSLLFHKKLSVFKNQNGGVSRLLSLFNMFKIEGLIDNANYDVDYVKFENLLAFYRSQSIGFIHNSLNG